MRDRRTWANIQENPHACYLFLQHGHQGKRLYLTKTGDETNSERLFALRRRDYGEKEIGEDLHLVIFQALTSGLLSEAKFEKALGPEQESRESRESREGFEKKRDIVKCVEIKIVDWGIMHESRLFKGGFHALCRQSYSK